MPSDGTQTPQENAPISKLSDDVLHYIFSINTDLSLYARWTYYGLYYRRPASQSPFLTLLRCSHVSSDWRNTILLSPILWAAVFDLRYLRNHEWMEEVIRRTGQAPLSIIGEGRNFKISERVFRYFEENWERISSMDVVLTNFIPRISSDILESRAHALERVLCLLQRPAPLLEICWLDIRFHSDHPVTSSERVDNNLPDGFKFFNNHAPALVEFHSPILIDLRAPWLSQLQRLSLHGPLETADLLQALSSMPVLEILEDEQNSIISTHGQASLPTVCLPSLEEFKIDSREPNSRPYLDLLTHISSPSSKICLNFSIRGILEPTELLDRYFEPLVAILKSFSAICGLHDATMVGLDIFTDGFYFWTDVPQTGSSSFFVNLLIGRFPQDRIETLLAALVESTPMHTLKSLHLNFTMESELRDWNIYSPITNWFSLGQVEVLSLSGERTLEIFQYFQSKAPTPIFPHLHTLNLKPCPFGSDVALVKKLLNLYIELQRPIKTFIIHMGSYLVDHDGTCVDMRWLEAFNGLKVYLKLYSYESICATIEHICGSGNSDQLARMTLHHLNPRF